MRRWRGHGTANHHPAVPDTAIRRSIALIKVVTQRLITVTTPGVEHACRAELRPTPRPRIPTASSLMLASGRGVETDREPTRSDRLELGGRDGRDGRDEMSLA
jgi:hypothetical protein